MHISKLLLSLTLLALTFVTFEISAGGNGNGGGGGQGGSSVNGNAGNGGCFCPNRFALIQIDYIMAASRLTPRTSVAQSFVSDALSPP